MINFDLENSPIQIRTNSHIGSGAKIKLLFFNEQGDSAGGFTLQLKSTPRYFIDGCTEVWVEIPIKLPQDLDRKWTLILSRAKNGIKRVELHCNNVEILNVVSSDTTCTDIDWKTAWSKDVEKIKFSHKDGASDYYRPGFYSSIRSLQET